MASVEVGPTSGTLKPRVSVFVTVEYRVDPKGTTRVKDIKTIRNDGSADVHLAGEFKQAVNHNVSQMRIVDSRSPNREFPFKIIRGDDHHQVAVAVEVPGGTPFLVEAGTERGLVFEYEMADSTTILGHGLNHIFLIRNRFGSVTYPYEFSTIEYRVKYQIEKPTDQAWWQRLIERPTLLLYPAATSFRKSKTAFFVEYSFSCDARSVRHIHLALTVEPRYWPQWLAAFLVGAAASAAVAAAPLWLTFLARVFGG